MENNMYPKIDLKIIDNPNILSGEYYDTHRYDSYGGRIMINANKCLQTNSLKQVLKHEFSHYMMDNFGVPSGEENISTFYTHCDVMFELNQVVNEFLDKYNKTTG